MWATPSERPFEIINWPTGKLERAKLPGNKWALELPKKRNINLLHPTLLCPVSPSLFWQPFSAKCRDKLLICFDI